RYEGTVNQVLGDGIMALFGAPIAHEDHAARACYAALAMQAALGAYAEPHWPPLRGSRGACHSQRPAYGLFCGRADNTSCSAHGAGSAPRHYCAHGRDRAVT